MAYTTLLKTIVIHHPTDGRFKFEIYQDDNRLFYADIYQKNKDGFWILAHDEYGFKRASSLEDAESSCEKYIINYGK